MSRLLNLSSLSKYNKMLCGAYRFAGTVVHPTPYTTFAKMFTGVLLEASRSFVHSPSWPVAGVTTGRVPVMPATVGEGLPESVRGAIGRGDARAVAAWLDEGGGVDARAQEDATLLMGAACQGHEAMVRMLLQRGASINLQGSEGGTALMAAAVYGRTTICRCCSTPGPTPRCKPSTASRHSC